MAQYSPLRSCCTDAAALTSEDGDIRGTWRGQSQQSKAVCHDTVWTILQRRAGEDKKTQMLHTLQKYEDAADSYTREPQVPIYQTSTLYRCNDQNNRGMEGRI